MPLVRIRSVEFFAQLMAAKHGQKFYRKMKTRVELMLFSIRTIRTLFSHRFGRHAGNPGFSRAAGRAADSIAPKIMALAGSISKGMDFPKEFSARSALPSPAPIPIASMQSLRRRKAAFTGPTMPGSIGVV